MVSTSTQRRPRRIVIIGAGPGGLCMGIKLREAGFDDFVILERSDGVGGTWRRNTYPGAACDVQSALYSFSFAFKADWSRPYATQPEILAYMEDLAERYDLLRSCRFGTEVTGAVWDEATSQWTVRVADDEPIVADVVVSALGMFNELADPGIEGLDTFAGTTFHSANWDWDHDLAGERVAVIGSAASAVQFVPVIADQVGRLDVYQRTANWILPKADTPYTDEELESFRNDPTPMLQLREELFRSMDTGMLFGDLAAIAEREAIAIRTLSVVQDPQVRAKFIPNHPWGCKRPLFSNVFYPVFNRPNVELVTDTIERVDEHSVITVDGVRREIDTLILATGFAATKYLAAIDVVGRDGRHIVDAWNDGAAAHLGVTTAGFPNLFMLYGPNTNNGSILVMIEFQVAHIVAHLRRMLDEDISWVDVRPEPMDAYNVEVQEAMDGVVVWNAGCNGYYRSPSGRVVTQWPFSMTNFRQRTEVIEPADYESAPWSATGIERVDVVS
ncbi:MAG: NAD(P)/FAD-dependent oxidoreductase [Ilumatobacteraceae bacterium]|nr:NAD(P)/FAD-dependent oxidoreductase [Ilumatobacteraceae bacterium]